MVAICGSSAAGHYRVETIPTIGCEFTHRVPFAPLKDVRGILWGYLRARPGVIRFQIHHPGFVLARSALAFRRVAYRRPPRIVVGWCFPGNDFDSAGGDGRRTRSLRAPR